MENPANILPQNSNGHISIRKKPLVMHVYKTHIRVTPFPPPPPPVLYILWHPSLHRIGVSNQTLSYMDSQLTPSARPSDTYDSTLKQKAHAIKIKIDYENFMWLCIWIAGQFILSFIAYLIKLFAVCGHACHSSFGWHLVTHCMFYIFVNYCFVIKCCVIFLYRLIVMPDKN